MNVSWENKLSLITDLARGFTLCCAEGEAHRGARLVVFHGTPLALICIPCQDRATCCCVNVSHWLYSVLVFGQSVLRNVSDTGKMRSRCLSQDRSLEVNGAEVTMGVEDGKHQHIV